MGTRVGVLPDLGDAAIVVPTQDEEALADALASVLDDPARAAAMRAAAAEVVANFDIDSLTGRLMALYDEMAPTRATPS